MGSNRNSHLLLVVTQDGTVNLKTGWQFLTKLNTLLPYNPAITLFGIYSNELKTYVRTKTCTRMFIVALSIIAKT